MVHCGVLNDSSRWLWPFFFCLIGVLGPDSAGLGDLVLGLHTYRSDGVSSGFRLVLVWFSLSPLFSFYFIFICHLPLGLRPG